jgi:hypothetical protein
MNPATPHVYTLLAQLDVLKSIHRSGESPNFGQVEALFDQAALVRAALQAADQASKSAAWPTSSPVDQAARRLVELVAASLTGGVA